MKGQSPTPSESDFLEALWRLPYKDVYIIWDSPRWVSPDDESVRTKVLNILIQKISKEFVEYTSDKAMRDVFLFLGKHPLPDQVFCSLKPSFLRFLGYSRNIYPLINFSSEFLGQLSPACARMIDEGLAEKIPSWLVTQQPPYVSDFEPTFKCFLQAGIRDCPAITRCIVNDLVAHKDFERLVCLLNVKRTNALATQIIEDAVVKCLQLEDFSPSTYAVIKPLFEGPSMTEAFAIRIFEAYLTVSSDPERALIGVLINFQRVNAQNVLKDISSYLSPEGNVRFAQRYTQIRDPTFFIILLQKEGLTPEARDVIEEQFVGCIRAQTRPANAAPSRVITGASFYSEPIMDALRLHGLSEKVLDVLVAYAMSVESLESRLCALKKILDYENGELPEGIKTRIIEAIDIAQMKPQDVVTAFFRGRIPGDDDKKGIPRPLRNPSSGPVAMAKLKI